MEVGGEIGYPIAFPSGSVTPFFSSYWRHEFEHDLQMVTARMAQDLRAQPVRFDYATDGADADSAVLAVGANAAIGDRIGLRGEVSTLRGDRFFTSTVASLQARVRF
jgi:outer membrane autotransporter protein